MNKAGRPYRLHPAEDGREFRSELLPMPTTEELLASLSTHSKEEIMVLAFARGASTGYKRGLGQRDRLIGELIALNYLDLSDLRVGVETPLVQQGFSPTLGKRNPLFLHRIQHTLQVCQYVGRILVLNG